MQEDMDQVQRDLMAMAGLVEHALRNALAAVRSGDADQAAAVVAADDPIDEMENRIDDECLLILARHQPVACDLRRTWAVTLITSELERVGDLAASIAK